MTHNNESYESDDDLVISQYESDVDLVISQYESDDDLVISQLSLENGGFDWDALRDGINFDNLRDESMANDRMNSMFNIYMPTESTLQIYGNDEFVSQSPFGNDVDLTISILENDDEFLPISFRMDNNVDDNFDSVFEDFINLQDLELPQAHSPRSILHVPQPVEDIFDFLNGP